MMFDWLLTNTPLLTYLAHAHNITNTYARDIWKRREEVKRALWKEQGGKTTRENFIILNFVLCHQHS